ncbi:variable surface protein Vir18 [Plasmodium vivax India VII]|uniref:Variable surface protein Vir18 n=1 Tax=Plasmodium vivax India VII TaxID=1077284 RepID=A0A0J9SIN7_PLAVI|nr:variable surface protein Vir18 [Plasmodium vivax India VII]
MHRYFGNQRSIFDNWQKYSGGNCLNKYSRLKLEIEEEIDAFNQKTHKNFYQEWDKINKKIIRKNSEIKDCVENRHISNDLYAVHAIKSFRQRCPKPNAPTCSNSSPSQAIKSPDLKKTVTERSCKAGKGCNKAIAVTELEKGKSQSKAPEGDSKTISFPGPDSKHQRQNNSIGQEPGNTDIISQPQPSVARSYSHVVAELKEPEQIDNGDSTASSREKAPAQRLSVIEPSKENTFETPPGDQHLQTVTAVESDTGASSQVRVSGENIPQSKIPLDETHGANTTSQQSNDVTVSRGKDGDDQTVATNTHGPESAAEGASLHHNHLNGYRISASTGDLSSASAELDTRNDNHTGNVTTNSESPPVKTPCTEASSDQASGSETLCYKRDDNELDISTGYILDKVHKTFDAIPNKEHVIKASAPMGIVLLLGLLFKYTPLWRVLTKKNRKKGASINQELHSVLQEPSIMDEERSIPFSYGAFEYSTFDQNVY